MYQPPHTRHVSKKIKIEAVTVCVNYSDFLAVTLPHNLQFIDRIVVVTDTKDKETKRICDFYGVECVQTDVFYENGAEFNKGKAINEGLARLKQDGWVLHFDSDIWFSPHLRVVLDNRHLDPECIYGIDRLMCHGYNSWANFVNSPVAINELYYLVQPKAFPMGSRVAHYNQPDGWFPIGFFQLWHPSTSGIHTYPTAWSGADHTDVVFSKAFPIGKRHLIPETFVIHLDSEKGPMGANWNGRTTKLFISEPTAKSASEVTSSYAPAPIPVPEPKQSWFKKTLTKFITWLIAFLHTL